jgi:hypothetical protein
MEGRMACARAGKKVSGIAGGKDVTTPVSHKK